VNRKRLFNFLKIIISIALIYFILRGIDLQKLKAVLTGARLSWLVLALAFSFGGVLARVKRWHVLLTSLRVRVPFWELTQIYFIGFLFNNLLPSGLGGDAVRMMEVGRHSGRAGDAVTSVLVDRMVGLFGSLGLALLALVFRWNAVPTQIAIASVVIVLGIVGAAFFLINETVYRTLRRVSLIRRLTDIKFISSLFASFQDYNLSTLGRAYSFSLLLTVSLIGMNASIGTALGAYIALEHYLVFVPLASVVLILPISFAGLGVRESAYVFLFGQVGVVEEIALSISLLVYFIGNAIPGLMGGVIYLLRGARDIKSEELNVQREE